MRNDGLQLEYKLTPPPFGYWVDVMVLLIMIPQKNIGMLKNAENSEADHKISLRLKISHWSMPHRPRLSCQSLLAHPFPA